MFGVLASLCALHVNVLAYLRACVLVVFVCIRVYVLRMCPLCPYVLLALHACCAQMSYMLTCLFLKKLTVYIPL